MNLLIRQFVPVTLATYLCIQYVDRPVSLIIRDSLSGFRNWSLLTSSLPDTLLVLVIIMSISASLGYFYRKKRLLLDANTRLFGFIALALPVSYIVKTVLKYLCGRVETRVWLQNPQLYEFHWLHGGAGFSGFPSGHMIVFTTLLAATGRYLDGCKQLCYSILAILAVMLVITNYHFVGDIISGAYVGFLVEACSEGVYSRFNK
jgi:membrane-associated phospholipid phosphatase